MTSFHFPGRYLHYYRYYQVNATRVAFKLEINGVEYYPPNGRIWCYNAQTMQKLIDDGRIKFGLTDDSSPKRKLYYRERIAKGDKKTPSSLVLDAGTTKDGTITIMNLFEGNKVFDYPKSVEFMKRLIRYGTYNGKGIILDFFSGSSTTAHAVMQLNFEDEGCRKYIMVQVQEDLDLALISSKTKETIKNAIVECDKLNVQHSICEIGKERIRRAGAKIKEEKGLIAQDLDVGFRDLKLDSSNMKDVYYHPADYEPSLFDNVTDNIKEDRTSQDLLFQVMLDLGVLLSSKIEEINIDGKHVYNVANGFLIACFDNDVTDATVKAIAQKKPYYAVFRDSSIATDSVATNIDQIFATYSPETVRKVL